MKCDKDVRAVRLDMFRFQSQCLEVYCEHTGFDPKNFKPVATPSLDDRAVKPEEFEAKGELAAKASKVIMKILYGARFARFDLLRAVCRLACHISRWTAACDRRLHRLVSYIHSSTHHRMYRWVGDNITAIEPHLFADADFASCTATQRSTSGAHLCMRGPATCFPPSGEL